MNEIIDKLFGQALDETIPETWTTLNSEQLNRVKTRFAELIIKECNYKVNKYIDDYLDIDSIPDWVFESHFNLK